VTDEAVAVESIPADTVKRPDSVDTICILTASTIVTQTLVYIWYKNNNFTL